MLTKDSPLADGVYGIDNTFGARAVGEDVLAPYDAKGLPESAEQYRLDEGSDRLTPVDYSDVCVNVDDTWFAKEGLAPPRTLDDLTKPAYKDLFVTPGATTSSPGLAFLLATVVAEGEDGWKDYWQRLMANGAKVTSGWTDAYEVDFTAGGGNGDRPIVTSYSSSPPFTIPEGGGKPTTSALLDTCFRQVEYAGVLKGSDNPAGMEKFIDFMLEKDFQSALPDNMYVYPVDSSVALPESWAAYAKPAPKPLVDARRGDRGPPQRVAARLEGHHQQVTSVGVRPTGRQHRRIHWATVAVAALPLTALVLFFVYPVAGMLARGLWPDGSLDLGGVVDVLARPRTRPGALVHPVVGRRSPPWSRSSPGCPSRSCCTGCGSRAATSCVPWWWCRSCCPPWSSGWPSGS